MVKYVHWKVKFKRSNFIKIQFYLIRRCIIHFIRHGDVQPEQHVDSISRQGS